MNNINFEPSESVANYIGLNINFLIINRQYTDQ